MQSLRTQLIISHLALVVLMGLVMAVSIFQFYRLSFFVERILQQDFQTVIVSQQIDSALYQEESAFNLLASGDNREARISYRSARMRYEDAFVKVQKLIDSPDEEGLLKTIAVHDIEVQREANQLFTSADAAPGPSHDDVRSSLRQVVQPAFAEMRNATVKLKDMNEASVRENYKSAQNSANRATTRSLVITFGTLGLAVLIALMLVQRSLVPLADLAQRAERIASGVFQPTDSVARADEIGALSKSFSAMEQKLAEMRRTEARRLQRAEQMSDAALESLYDPVIVTDARRRIVYLNRAAEGLFGHVATEARKPLEEHISDHRIQQTIRKAVEQQISSSEDEAAMIPIRVGEAERTYRLRATPMMDGSNQLLGSVTVLEDITHLRVLDRLKTEFIGVASHELRTPVTSLMLGNQMLLDETLGPLTGEQSEVVGAMAKDLTRLDTLMRDLLDVTRLEAGSAPPRLELVSPHDIVSGPLATLMPQAVRKGVHLEVNVPLDLPKVRADRTQIGRVVTNLVSNAIRHTEKGGHVNVLVSEVNKDVSFRVEDTGEGIPKEYLDRIFERFVQVPGATQGGAGLGLSIAQNIVRTHGGLMTVESRVGEGSSFGFTLPIDVLGSREGQTV